MTEFDLTILLYYMNWVHWDLVLVKRTSLLLSRCHFATMFVGVSKRRAEEFEPLLLATDVACCHLDFFTKKANESICQKRFLERKNNVDENSLSLLMTWFLWSIRSILD